MMKLFPIQYPSQGLTIRGLGYGPQSGSPRKLRVILIHGYSSSKHAVDVVAAQLAQADFPVISIDLPGHKLGQTGGALTSFSMAVQAAIDADVMLPSPCSTVFVGHSMGAAAALVAASLHAAAAGAEKSDPGPQGRLR
jgi:pimeloyl-ACP methyl ester carboxylesterase